jgi:hypothetical protein
MLAIDNAREPDRSLVFISYRFGDSSYAAGRLARDLIATFGRDQVFFDHESICVGEPFPDVIRDALARARVLIVLIGPHWLKAQDSAFRRLIDDTADYVYQEVLAGLHAPGDVTVLPVLLQNASRLKQDALPRALAQLASLKPLHLDAPKWEEGVKAIATVIEMQGIPPRSTSSPHSTHGQDQPASSRDIRGIAPTPRAPLLALGLLLLSSLCLASYLAIDHWVNAAQQTLTQSQQEDLRHLVEGLRSAAEHIIAIGPHGERGESAARREAGRASRLPLEAQQLLEQPGAGGHERLTAPSLAAELLWRAQLVDQRIAELLQQLRTEHSYWTTSGATSLAAHQGSAAVDPDVSETTERLAKEAAAKIATNTALLERAKALIAGAATMAERARQRSNDEAAPGTLDVAQRLVPLAGELATLAGLVADELDVREREEAVKFLIRTAKFDARPMTERSPPALPRDKWDGYFFLYSSQTSFALCLAHGADPTRENQLFGNLKNEERDIIKRLKDAALNESEATQAHLTHYEFLQLSTGQKAPKMTYAIALQSPPRTPGGGETTPYHNWWIGAGYYPEPQPGWPWSAWLPMPLSGCVVLLVLAHRLDRRPRKPRRG